MDGALTVATTTVRLLAASLLALVGACASSRAVNDGASVAPAATPEADIAAARAVFEKNLAAIQAKDRDAYLASYRQDERLVRVGIEGPSLGFADLAEGTAPSGSDEWPERLDADDVQLHWLAPGVVYGSYRYRVTFDGVTTSGLSERVFLRGDDGRWHIAVTTAFEGAGERPSPLPAEASPPPEV